MIKKEQISLDHICYIRFIFQDVLPVLFSVRLKWQTRSDRAWKCIPWLLIHAPLLAKERHFAKRIVTDRRAGWRRESAHEKQRRGNSDDGSKRVAAENAVPYHGGIDNRERSLFQGGWTLLRPSRAFSLSFLHCATPLATLSCPHLSPPPISPLQIGLVVLRVHQDNSGLALCPFQENAANGGGGGSRAMGRKGGAASRTYCTDAARGLCFGLFEICGAPRNLSFSFSLFRCDTLDKCKKCIVKTSRSVDPHQKPVRASPPLLLPFSSISRWNCPIVARDASDKLERCARWSVNNVNIFTAVFVHEIPRAA